MINEKKTCPQIYLSIYFITAFPIQGSRGAPYVKMENCNVYITCRENGTDAPGWSQSLIFVAR